jgi:hypothetical protein
MIQVMMTMIVRRMLTVAVLRWRCCIIIDDDDDDEDVNIYITDYETIKQ